MKAKILIIIFLTIIGNSYSQIISNEAFYFSNTSGDLNMRRYSSGDLIWKPALVPTASTLYINYSGAFSDGIKINGSKLVIDGDVGIGTIDTQGFKLGVKGKIAAEEVKVALYSNWWPDFVFENSYKLPTLKEVEQHIREKGHLKDIPSAKEVEENGIFLGEMDSKLLQKIEELTLYTIDQEKKLQTQEDEIKEQDIIIKELNERLLKLEELVLNNHQKN